MGYGALITWIIVLITEKMKRTEQFYQAFIDDSNGIIDRLKLMALQ